MALVQGRVTLIGQRFQAGHPRCFDNELSSPLLQNLLRGCGATGLASTHLMPVISFLPAYNTKTVSKCCQMSPWGKTAKRGEYLPQRYRLDTLPRHTSPPMRRLTVASSSGSAFYKRDWGSFQEPAIKRSRDSERH